MAIKFEKKSARCPQLRHEFKVYRELQGSEGVGRVLYYGTYRDCNVMVMELLGPSLEDFFNKCGRKFSLRTTLRLADQLLERCEALHENHLIHRDIKPANFVMGLPNSDRSSTVYCIDFGLSKRYRHPHTLQHIPYKEGRSLTGTPRYASVANHRGIETSRRDDLESIGYILVYFLLGKLPWQGLKLPANLQGTASQKHQLILDKKQLTSLPELCRGCPKEFQQYLQYCRELQFDAKPDLPYLRTLFKRLAQTHGYDGVNPNFDWEKNDKKITNNIRPATSIPLNNHNHHQNKEQLLTVQKSNINNNENNENNNNNENGNNVLKEQQVPLTRAKSANPAQRAAPAVVDYSQRPTTPSGLKTYTSAAAVGGSSATTARPWTAMSQATAMASVAVPTEKHTTSPSSQKKTKDEEQTTEEGEEQRLANPISSRKQVIISYATQRQQDRQQRRRRQSSTSDPNKNTQQRSSTKDDAEEQTTPRPLTAPYQAQSAASKRAWRFLEGDDQQPTNFATAAAAARTAPPAAAAASQAWGDAGRKTYDDHDRAQRDDYYQGYATRYGSHFSGTPLSLVRHRRAVSRSGGTTARPSTYSRFDTGTSSNLQATGYHLQQTASASKAFWGPQQVSSFLLLHRFLYFVAAIFFFPLVPRHFFTLSILGEPPFRLEHPRRLAQHANEAIQRHQIPRTPCHQAVIRPQSAHVLVPTYIHSITASDSGKRTKTTSPLRSQPAPPLFFSTHVRAPLLVTFLKQQQRKITSNSL